MPVPSTEPRPSTLPDAGHGQVAQPVAEGLNNPPVRGGPASPWTRHQKCAHKLSTCCPDSTIGMSKRHADRLALTLGHCIGLYLMRAPATAYVGGAEGFSLETFPNLRSEGHLQGPV